MTETKPIIIAEDVHKWYGKFHVLQGVSLSVERGEVVPPFNSFRKYHLSTNICPQNLQS